MLQCCAMNFTFMVCCHFLWCNVVWWLDQSISLDTPQCVFVGVVLHLQTSLLFLLSANGISVSQLATDRSPQVRAYMKKYRPAIEHQYDVWHFVKSVIKRLHKVTKKKDMQELRAWIPSIANHLWWCAASCKGDAVLLMEKWQSIQHHIVNIHRWTG